MFFFIEFAFCVTHVTECALLIISTLDYQGYALEVCLLNIDLSFKATETNDVVYFYVISIYVIYVTKFATYYR